MGTMAAKSSRSGKFSEFMSYHIFRYINGNMLPAIMDSNGMAHHLRKNSGTPGPCFYDPLFPGIVHSVNFGHQLWIHVRPLFQ
jgi:hypothetical protein